MDELVVEALDPHLAADADLTGYYDVKVAAMAVDEPDAEVPTRAGVVERLRNPFPGLGDAAYWVARCGPRVAAFAYVRFPEEENEHIALTEVVVHPEFRRRGFGSAVLAAVLPELRVRGRSTVEGWNVPRGGAGEAWAARLGFRESRAIVVQLLDISEGVRASWPSSPPHGYRLERWIGPAPEGLVESYAAARSAIQDAPTGDSEFSAPEWTPARVREHEEELAGNDVELRVVVALHGDDVVGLTEVVLTPQYPGMAIQSDTVVVTAHRGHGLGLAMKSAMAAWLVAERPGLGKIRTATNADNDHMVRVNHEMGFVSTLTEAVVAEDLDALAERLSVGPETRV